MSMTYYAIVGNMIAAGILGGIVGAQRQAAHKPAGFRTHMLVALGSCAFMEISRFSGDDRIAAGVITGIGFLGAGAIVRAGLNAHGLTTAASIWAVAAVGLALGFGTPQAYALATALTLLVFIALSFSDRWLDQMFPPKNEVEAWVTFEPETISPDKMVALLSRACAQVQRTERFRVESDGETRVAVWLLSLQVADLAELREDVLAALKVPGVRRVALTEVTPT
jgi:putative Mg2+ transporter-C (MgtC) family protein